MHGRRTLHVFLPGKFVACRFSWPSRKLWSTPRSIRYPRVALSGNRGSPTIPGPGGTGARPPRHSRAQGTGPRGGPAPPAGPHRGPGREWQRAILSRLSARWRHRASLTRGRNTKLCYTLRRGPLTLKRAGNGPKSGLSTAKSTAETRLEQPRNRGKNGDFVAKIDPRGPLAQLAEQRTLNP